MQNVIVLRGIQNSGKSTFARNWVQQHPEYVIVNRDSLREMFIPGYSTPDYKFEDMITSVEHNIVKEALQNKKSIIWDNTFIRPSHFRRALEIITSFKETTFEVKIFETSLETCLERNRLRERKVPEDIIKDFSNRLRDTNKEFWKVYNEFKEKKIEEAKPVYKMVSGDKEGGRTLIVDVDGTIAHRVNRSPYDYSKVKDDVVDEFIRNISNTYFNLGYSVVIVSGREDSCKQDTIDWLKKNEVLYHELFMRKTGDTRKDDIIKEEIYRNHIEPNYNVMLVLDDRARVIKMFRSLGLKVLQVQDGNF